MDDARIRIAIADLYTDKLASSSIKRHGKSFIALSNCRNRSYDVTMVESVLRLRPAAWPLVIGMIAGGVVALFAGSGLFWALVALALAALLIAQFVTFQEPIRPAEEKTDDAMAALPPMTRVLLDQLPIPVMLLDDDERVLFVNHSMRDVLGPGLDRKRASSVLRNPDVLAAIARSAARLFLKRAVQPAGADRTALPGLFRAHQRVPPVTALLLHDLTAIRRSEQMRADFIANASHELRTPLAAVSGFIETLRGHAKDDEAAREQFLDIMAAEAARMRRLIDDLLSLTRIEMNEHVPPRRPHRAGRGGARGGGGAGAAGARRTRSRSRDHAEPDLPPVIGRS